jgi:hypothetical protein
MNLSKIIEDSGLRIEYVAQKLFPDNKHPYNALNRVVSRNGELSAEQLRILATLTGRSADNLLGLSWSGSIDASGLLLTKGDYRITYTPGTGMFSVWRGKPGSIEPLGVFAIDEDVTTVRAFLASVDNFVNELT